MSSHGAYAVLGDSNLKRLGILFVVVIVASGLAFLFTWSDKYCNMHSADSMLSALMSTQKLTWYYWGQNRFGNLLPALTSWISDVDLNFKVQILLRAFCAGLGPLFIIIILKPKARLIAVYCAALAAVVLIERDWLTWWYWADYQPYGPSLALLIVPLLIAKHWSWRFDLRSTGIASLVLFFLVVALWVNLSAVLLILPLFLGLAIAERSKSFFALAALTLFAYALVSPHGTYIGGYSEYAVFRPSWAATMEAASNLARQIDLLPALLLAAGVIWAGWELRLDHRILRAALVMLGSVLVAFLVTANLQWVQLNLSLPRYFVFPITAIICTSATLIVEAIMNSFAKTELRSHLVISASLALLILGGALNALPLNMQCSFIEGRPGIREIAYLVSRTNASFVDGDYWIVWPAVFLANRNTREPVFGLPWRGEGAREPITNFVASHPHPVMLCIAKPLTACVGRFDDVLGWPRNVSAHEIASGELVTNPPISWVAAVLNYGLNDESAPH